jgi:hypothetical protein
LISAGQKLGIGMEKVSVHTIFFGIYFIIWLFLLVGVVLVKRKSKLALKLHALFVKRQIQKFQYPPFKQLVNLWVSNKYLLTSVTFIVIIIIPAVFLFFLLGVILVSPILAIVQGFTVGILIGKFGRKEMLWAVIVGMFEIGYWALSGALGISVTLTCFFEGLSFIDSLILCLNNILSGYWIPLIIFIVGNAFGEVAGPIYLNIKSPISLVTLSQGLNENEDIKR